MITNRAASVRARLKQHADATGQDYNSILTRYALERLMYRLSVSGHAPNFLLKGALLFGLWFDAPHRSTRDIDLLGFGSDDPELVAATFREICAIAVDDGIAATFAQRGTVLPQGLPIGLTAAFASDSTKRTQWQAFLRKSRLQAPPLAEVVAELAGFSHTALTRAASIRGPA